jgi:hypothetical protein
LIRKIFRRPNKMQLSAFIIVQREEQLKSGPFPGSALHPYLAAGVLYDLIRNGQPQTGSFPGFLGGKKRIEDFWEIFG